MSDITLNTQSITGNHNFVPPGTDWNLGSGSKKWNGGYFGTIIADNGIPAGTAATGGDKIGQIRFSINPNIEPGYLALNGQEVNREDYPNLWEWVQQQVGFLVEEGEWQSISTAPNGNVGKYSVGNGSTTFRLPNLGCWVRGGGEAGTANGVGGNLDAGLPNIEGGYTGTQDDYDMFVWQASQEPENRGALSSVLDSVYQSGVEFGGSGKFYSVRFDASDSTPIYGNAETVPPESIVGIWLVKAYHVPVDNMGNTITVNGVPPDENGNITIDALTNAIPVGTILPFSSNTIPEGFLACNGAGISAETYSALYAVIGNIYGGDSTTFNLPNAESDTFLQGNSTPDTFKAPGLPNITGYVNHTGTSCMRSPGGAFYAYSTSSYRTADSSGHGIGLGIDASRSNAVYGASDTVQPPAITVRFIIKY